MTFIKLKITKATLDNNTKNLSMKDSTVALSNNDLVIKRSLETKNDACNGNQNVFSSAEVCSIQQKSKDKDN